MSQYQKYIKYKIKYLRLLNELSQAGGKDKGKSKSESNNKNKQQINVVIIGENHHNTQTYFYDDDGKKMTPSVILQKHLSVFPHKQVFMEGISQHHPELDCYGLELSAGSRLLKLAHARQLADDSRFNNQAVTYLARFKNDPLYEKSGDKKFKSMTMDQFLQIRNKLSVASMSKLYPPTPPEYIFVVWGGSHVDDKLVRDIKHSIEEKYGRTPIIKQIDVTHTTTEKLIATGGISVLV